MALKKLKIDPSEIEYAAMYFAMSNCAVLELVNGETNIRHAYNNVSGIVEMETGCSLDEEKADWVKMIKKEKQNGYCFTEWNKSKEKYGWKF